MAAWVTGGKSITHMPHIPALDAIRFLAAVIVMFFHTGWQNPFGAIPVDFGWVGVEIFFVISGFVISGSSRNVTAGRFIRSRVARLYPAAICCLTLDYAVTLICGSGWARSLGLSVFPSGRAWLASMTLFLNPFIVGSLWTLPIELAFYALILLLIAARATNRMVGLAYALIVVSLPYLAGAGLSTFGLMPFDVPPLGNGYLNLTFVRHGCFFGLGILLFLATEKNTAAISPMRGLMIALAILLSCLEIVDRAAELAPAYRHQVTAASLSVQAVLVFLAGILVIWAFAHYHTGTAPDRLGKKLLRKLGLMSYPIYLLHEAVGGTLIGYLDRQGMNPILAQIAGAAVVVATSLIVVSNLEPRAKTLLMRVVDPVIIALERLPLFGRRSTVPPS